MSLFDHGSASLKNKFVDLGLLYPSSPVSGLSVLFRLTMTIHHRLALLMWSLALTTPCLWLPLLKLVLYSWGWNES